MEIYNYHPEYKHYIGSSNADESPLEPGVSLIPAHATEISPPHFLKDKIPVFNGTSWDIIEDKRGIYYSIQTQQVIENYNPLITPENATTQQPPEIPEGYGLIWNDGWELKLIPVLTPEEKLKQSGLTVDELKQLLELI